MYNYNRKSGLQRGGAIRRNIIGNAPEEKKDKKPRDYTTAKRIAKNVAIGIAATAAVTGLAIGGHSLYDRYQMQQLHNAINLLGLPPVGPPPALIGPPPLPLVQIVPAALQAPAPIPRPAVGFELDLQDLEGNIAQPFVSSRARNVLRAWGQQPERSTLAGSSSTDAIIMELLFYKKKNKKKLLKTYLSNITEDKLVELFESLSDEGFVGRILAKGHSIEDMRSILEDLRKEAILREEDEEELESKDES
jgi:hypothetical protein